jgi:hypothetical protein
MVINVSPIAHCHYDLAAITFILNQTGSDYQDGSSRSIF